MQVLFEKSSQREFQRGLIATAVTTSHDPHTSFGASFLPLGHGMAGWAESLTEVLLYL